MRGDLPIRALVVEAVVGSAAVAMAQPAPDYDFQWTTVGNVGNAPYTSSNPDDVNVNGRGSVNYEFRASRLEITTGQWVEFLNAFAPFAQSPLNGHATGSFPQRIGAGLGPVLPNGNRTLLIPSSIPNAAMLPVGGISWRDAARYCNWLHNNKEVSLAAISTGAYDTTTWGGGPGGVAPYTDDPRRMPGAKFFMPEISEYLKATHYDPNRYGPGQGGYWQYKTASDTPPISGLPGVGTTSAGYQPDGSVFAAWNIPLGAYTDVQTAYGLWDTSGGGKEWIESWTEQVTVNGRMFSGSFAGASPDAFSLLDTVGWISGSDNVQSPTPFASFRIYSTVPSPGASVLFVAGVLMSRRKRSSCR